MSSDIQIVNPLEVPDWDTRVAAFPSASVFHTTGWARVLVDTYGFKPCYFVLTEDSPPSSVLRPWSAILPMMEVDSWLTGRRGVSLPFTDECPPLSLLSEGRRLTSDISSLFEAAAAHGRKRRWRYLELRGLPTASVDSLPPPAHDLAPTDLTKAPASTSYFGHCIDLEPDDAALFRRLNSSARRAIRKAEESGVTIEVSDSPASLAKYYELHCITRRRQGQPPQPWSFFENIRRNLIGKNQGRVFIASYLSTPVAGAVFLTAGRHALYKYGASDSSHQHLRGNDLLFWQAISSFAKEGFQTLDFGRTSLGNDGLRQFKLKWGVREFLLTYKKFNCQTGSWLTSEDKATGWHTRLLRLMPGTLARIVGATLYKHVA